MKLTLCLPTMFLLSTCLFGAANATEKTEKTEKSYEIRVATGVKSIFGPGFGFLPLPVSVIVNTDIKKIVRIHADVGHHIVEDFTRATIGAGVALPFCGKEAPLEGGFQLRLPLLAEAGFLSGYSEAGDGYDDELDWLLLGFSSGVDFTWWKAGGLGFYVGLKAGLFFPVDLGSDYDDDYSAVKDQDVLPEAGLHLGVAI